MRENLAKLGINTRAEFNAVVSNQTKHLSKKRDKSKHHDTKVMILLYDVRDKDNNQLCNHLWVELTNRNLIEKIKPNNTIGFRATVGSYVKGHSGDRRLNNSLKLDYCLFDIRDVKVLSNSSSECSSKGEVSSSKMALIA